MTELLKEDFKTSLSIIKSSCYFIIHSVKPDGCCELHKGGVYTMRDGSDSRLYKHHPPCIHSSDLNILRDEIYCRELKSGKEDWDYRKIVSFYNRSDEIIHIVAQPDHTNNKTLFEWCENQLDLSTRPRPPEFKLLKVASQSTKDIAARFFEQTGRVAASAGDEYEAAYAADLDE